MKKLIAIGMLVFALLDQARAAEINTFTAQITEKDDRRPTKYFIQLKFPKGVSYSRSKLQKRSFVLTDKAAGQKVEIVALFPQGAPDTPVAPGENYLVRGVAIYANIEPSRTYQISFSPPDGTLQTIEVRPSKGDESSSKESSINIHQRYLDLEVTPFAADAKALGFKYDMHYNLKTFPAPGRLLRFEIESHGEIELGGEATATNAVQNSLKAGFKAMYVWNVPFTIAFGDESRQYSYPLGLNIAPAEFEMDKKAKIIDYTAKAEVGGAIPYLDYPSLLWAKAFRLDVPFFPPTLFTGIAFLRDIKSDGTDPLEKLGRIRWDTEFLYDIPIHERIDFRFEWHSYVGIEKSFWENSVETGPLLYMDDKRSHGFTLFYQTGSAPPLFKKTTSWRIGYTAKF
jgi:hypothetical protein